MDWSMDDLEKFRDQQTSKEIILNSISWKYYDTGTHVSEFAIVFLHGTTGSKEIFWLQISSLMNKYRVISFDLPPIVGVEKLAEGIHKILIRIGIKKILLLGTSFGGYLAQFFCSKYSEMIDKLVLSNTFITTHVYYQKYRKLLLIEKLIPVILIKRIMKKGLLTIVHNQTREYLIDQLERNLTKKILMARLKSFVTDKVISKPPIEQVLIIETINDPLVPKQLQDELKKTYPQATVKTLREEANHFPYLIISNEYNQILTDFLKN
ncbi:MAG: alpha/beta fold hydrolase [Candidatus Hermodarchaeota archaeon]